MPEAMTRFRCKLLDKRHGGEICQETVEAKSKTEARKALAKEWKRDVPRDARNHGFVPWRDVRVVWQ